MAVNQQFNLKWNNHQNNILQIFLEQFSSETLVDVTLSCQGQFLRAHKMVLSACSPYFQELFQVHQVQHPVIIMYGMKFTDVKQIVEFMYKGEVKVLEAELDSLLAAAEMLQIKGLSHVRNKYQKGDIQEGDAQTPGRNSEPPPLEPCAPSLAPTPTSSATTSVLASSTSNQTQSHSTLPQLTPAGKTAAPSQVLQPTASNQAYQSTQRATVPSVGSAKRKKSPDAGPKQGETASKKQNCQTTPQQSKDAVQAKSQAEEDELPATIKVEPLDIRDIDEELPWEPPRLVIDMRDEGSKKAGLNQVRTSLLKVRASSDLVLPAGEDTLKENEPKQEPSDPLSIREWRGGKRVARIPRPPNAFMIFANEWRRKLAVENPKESNKEISVRLGIKWKNLTTEKKAVYYSASRIADEEHKRKYPNYYYSPKEARLRKSQQQTLRRRFALERMHAAAAQQQSKADKAATPDPLRFVKVFMKDPTTHGMFVAVESSNNSAGAVTPAPDAGAQIQDPADLEEEFLKLVEEGQVEAEIEEDDSGDMDGLTEPIDEEVIGLRDENEIEDTKPDLAELEAKALALNASGADKTDCSSSAASAQAAESGKETQVEDEKKAE